MIDLNKEAEEFSKQYIDSHNYIRPFIKGACSKYVRAQILQAKIDVLHEFNSTASIVDKISKLQQELKQLQDETIHES